MANNNPADKMLTEPVGKNEAIAGTAAEYGAYVNFGHRLRNGKFQPANPYLSAAGEIIAQKLVGKITAEQELQIKREVAASFDRQLKEGVEIIRYGDPVRAIEKATRKSIQKAAIDLIAAAKGNCPVADIEGGYLRNSLMWRTEDTQGGFNVW